MPETTSGQATTQKKYEPHLSELSTDAEQIERVRELVLEADTLEEMLQDFQRFGVTKHMYFLQSFARKSETHKETARTVARCISILEEGMDSTGTGALHYHRMQVAVELLAPLASGNPAQISTKAETTNLSEVNKMKEEESV